MTPRGAVRLLAAIVHLAAESMENRGQSLPRLRHSRRGRAGEHVALLAAGALLVGCTTTHALGRLDDPGVRAQLDAIAGNGDAIVHVRQPPGTLPPGTRSPPFGD